MVQGLGSSQLSSARRPASVSDLYTSGSIALSTSGSAPGIGHFISESLTSRGESKSPNLMSLFQPNLFKFGTCKTANVCYLVAHKDSS